MLEFYEAGKRKRRSLGHRDRERAKRSAEHVAAKLRTEQGRSDITRREDLTLQEVTARYLREVSPRNSISHQKYDARSARMFCGYFGSQRKVTGLGRQDWDRFAKDRSRGAVGPGDGPWTAVGARTVQKDLAFLSGVFNWATVASDGAGGALLHRNPFKGFKAPREKNPKRPILTEDEYQALLVASFEVDWRFRVALILAHETGHRIGAIRALRWSDVDLDQPDGGWVTWRAANDKLGREHRTPLTEAAFGVLREAREKSSTAFLLPSPKDPSRPVGKYHMRGLWRRAEAKAGLERVPGRGWHSCRRKFATELMHEPLKVVCQLGGWSDHKTVISCYQRPDDAAMRDALSRRAARGG